MRGPDDEFRYSTMANSGAAAAASVDKTTAHTPAMTNTGANTLRMKVTKLNFYYGKNHALHNVSMDVATNKVTAMIGPSGCGKSTLLRTLNRMHETLRHTRLEGEIALDGVNILTLDVTKLRRMVGMVFQKPNPFPEVHLRQCGLRPANQRPQGAPGRRRGKEPAPRRSLG